LFSGKAFVQARANLKSGVKSPLSAVRKALRYSFLASPGCFLTFAEAEMNTVFAAAASAVSSAR